MAKGVGLHKLRSSFILGPGNGCFIRVIQRVKSFSFENSRPMMHSYQTDQQLAHNAEMTPDIPTPVAHVEVVDGGVVLTFDDGEGAYLSADLMHEAVSKARELPEFTTEKQSVPTS
jgi:hypothetical protein